jgi:CHAT domain-containing protein/tetratricopeptide (TPR) repeat protein
MTPRGSLLVALGGLSLILGRVAIPDQAGGPPCIRVSDDFATGTLTTYQVEGEVAWRPGQVRLAPGARLTRPVSLGYTAEVRAVVRLPAEGDAREIRLSLQADKQQAAVALREADGQTVLVNLQDPEQVVPLDRTGPDKRATRPRWVVRFEVHYGLVQAKAWRQDEPEPKAWQSCRYSGETLWQPGRLAVEAGPRAAGALETIEVRGTSPELPLMDFRQRQLARARMFLKEADELSREGPSPKVRTKLDEAVKLFKEVRGSRHPETATGLYQLGWLLRELGEFAEARRCVEESLAIRRQVLGSRHPETAESLNDLGLLLLDLGELRQARAYVEQSVAISRAVFGSCHPETAMALNNLGAVLRQTGNMPEARACYEEALAIRRKVLEPRHPGTAESLNSLATLLLDMSRPEEAAPYLEEALAIARGALPPQHPLIATYLANQAGLFQDLGKLAEARACYEEALNIRQKALDPRHPETATCLNNLGVLLLRMGEFAEAHLRLEEALTVRRSTLGPRHPEVAESLGCLGVLLLETGQRTQAGPYLEEALAIARRTLPADHPTIAMHLMNLGRLHYARGELAEARAYDEEALAIRRKALPPGHPDIAEALNNLGLYLADMGRPADGRPYLEEALAIWREAPGPGYPHAAVALTNLGASLQDTGKYAEARACYEEAVAINENVLGPQHPETATVLGHLGVLLQFMGEEQQAWQTLARENAAFARHLARASTLSAQRDQGNLADALRNHGDRLVSLAQHRKELSAEQRAELLTRLLDWKAAAVAALRARQEALVLGTDPEAAALFGKLKAVRQQLANLLVQGPGHRLPEHYRRACDDLSRLEDHLERDLANRVQGYALVKQARRAGPEELARQLARGTVLIELIRYRFFDFAAKENAKSRQPARYAAVLLGRPATDQAEPVIHFVPLGEAESLDQAVHAWRAATARGLIDPAVERRLSARLWEPLARVLPADTEHLLIAPDGELALLPFEAFRLADDRYLVERFQVSYLSNGRDLMSWPTPPDRPGPALVLADPDFDALDNAPGPSPAAPAPTNAARSPDWQGHAWLFRSLPGFAAEARAVTRAIQAIQPRWDLQVLQRREASEEALAGITRPRLLYLITHGFFLADRDRLPSDRDRRGIRPAAVPGAVLRPLTDPRDDPRLRSGLALAGANQWQKRSERGLSDGLLTALEVQNLDLWGTELVVLSACETGLGQVRVGEGVLGLRRAFQQAGAQTVVASLWQVPDRDTERLMTEFLRRWLAGKPKAQALREAQLQCLAGLRQETEPTRRQAPPLYWAGFICHGRPD